MPEPRRYRVIDLVGSGAMGRVYRAEYIADSGFRRIVALKMLRGDTAGANASPRLRDEARMLGRLRHRAIANVDDLLQLDGQWTIVMDFLEAIDLLRVLADHGPMPPCAVAGVVAEAAAALHAAYTWPDGRGGTLGLLHRDLKPSNLLVSPHGETFLVDFGVARADVDREARSEGAHVGSLGYVAPERAEGIDVPAGDVYGLGVVAYELLTGEAFGRVVGVGRTDGGASARYDTMRAKAESRLGAVAPPLRDLVLAMLCFEPERRPSAREAASAARAAERVLPGPDLADWAAESVPRLMARVRAPTMDPLVGRTLAEAAAAPPSIPRRALPTFDGAGATINNILRIGATPEDEAEEAAADGPSPSRPPRRRSVVPLVVVTGLVLALAALGGAAVVAVGVAVFFTLLR